MVVTPKPAKASREDALLAERDLRELIRLSDERGELVVIEGADPNLEIGALYELSLEREVPPVLLFENIKGFEGHGRVVMNVRTAGVFHQESGMQAVAAARARRGQSADPIPPEIVETGPVLENVMRGDDVNVLAFPAPRWHELDGGAYIGTECMVITKDPDSEWVNAGTYRSEVQDSRTISVFIEPGKHGRVIRQKYWEKGEPCPMVLCVGQSPALAATAASAARAGESEFAVAGGRIGRAIQLVQGEVTGLPFPADAELVFEGYMYPPDVEARAEGPFGEWPGYYASDTRPEPVLRVAAVYHRDNPIISGQPPAKPTLPGRQDQRQNARASALLWDALENAGVPGIKGVWKMQGGGARFINVVAIDQEHPGHAKMAGLVATGSGPGAYLGRMTIIVDDDIDITNPVEVLWALATRWDPKTQTDIIDGCYTGHIDPLLSPDKRESGDITNSRAILYAVRPYHWRDQFPKVNAISPEHAEQVRAKWQDKLAFLRKG